MRSLGLRAARLLQVFVQLGVPSGVIHVVNGENAALLVVLVAHVEVDGGGDGELVGLAAASALAVEPLATALNM